MFYGILFYHRLKGNDWCGQMIVVVFGSAIMTHLRSVSIQSTALLLLKYPLKLPLLLILSLNLPLILTLPIFLRNMKEEKTQRQKEEEMEYVGNMWGWKFSFISLGIIVVFFILYLISEWQQKNGTLVVPQ